MKVGRVKFAVKEIKINPLDPTAQQLDVDKPTAERLYGLAANAPNRSVEEE